MSTYQTITLNPYNDNDLRSALDTYNNQTTKDIYYNIIERHTYYLDVQKCTNIEDLADAFITEEEFHKNWHNFSDHNISNKPNIYSMYFNDKIKSVLTEWGETIKPGSACTSIQTPAIKELYFELKHGYFINNFAPQGYTIQGDRIYNNEAESKRQRNLASKKAKEREDKRKAELAKPYVRQEEITYTDKLQLRNAIYQIFAYKHGIKIEYYTYDKKAAPFIKRNCNWPEIRKHLKKTIPKKQYPQDIIWIKKLWDTPDFDYHTGATK